VTKVVNIHEKRAYKRFMLELGCSLHIHGTEHVGITGNISRAGAYLKSLNPPLPEEMVGESGELSLELDDGQITTQCKIVFIGNEETTPTLDGVGVMFQLMPKETLAKLEGVIHSRRS